MEEINTEHKREAIEQQQRNTDSLPDFSGAKNEQVQATLSKVPAWLSIPIKNEAMYRQLPQGLYSHSVYPRNFEGFMFNVGQGHGLVCIKCSDKQVRAPVSVVGSVPHWIFYSDTWVALNMALQLLKIAPEGLCKTADVDYQTADQSLEDTILDKETISLISDFMIKNHGQIPDSNIIDAILRDPKRSIPQIVGPPTSLLRSTLGI